MTPPPEDAYADSMHAADVATFREQISTLQRDITAHDEKDNEQFKEVKSRLTRIEMALATALGGMIVLGWFINNKAQSILDLLAR